MPSCSACLHAKLPCTILQHGGPREAALVLRPAALRRVELRCPALCRDGPCCAAKHCALLCRTT
eukprot:10144497-Alexandrium_andersonii.AAC.1